MKKSLIAIIAMIFMGVTSVCADTIDELLTKRSDDCPISVTDGMSVVSAVPEPGQLVFTYAIDPAKVDFADLKSQSDMLHDVMASDMATSKNADTRKLVAYSQGNGVNIVLRFTVPNDSFDVVITPADLKY